MEECRDECHSKCCTAEMNGTLFAMMLPSNKNNTPASPADTGEAVITGRRKKHVSRCFSLKNGTKLHFMTLHNVPPTREKSLTYSVFLDEV